MADKDQVVPADLGVKPRVEPGGVYLLQSEYKSYLVFDAVRLEGERRVEARWAIVTIERCLLSKFGYPNDEAIFGHPFYKRGLEPYRVFEVLNSSLIEQMTAQNKISFPRWSGWDVRHWIFTFKDSTLECVGKNLQVEVASKPLAQVIASINEKMLPPDASIV